MFDSSGIVVLLSLTVIVIVVFFVLPSKKQKKQEEALLASVTTGDRVITVGGIHGVIVDADEDRLLLQVEDGQMIIQREAIAVEPSRQFYKECYKDRMQKNVKKTIAYTASP